MAQLIYSAICSLDGYVSDENGQFSWAAPDEEVHAFVNQRERGIGTYLYGRGMYETMVAWETMSPEGQSTVVREYAEIWRAADKIVYSASLAVVDSARTRLESGFDPVVVERLKEATDLDMSVGGPTLAAQAFHAGIVDEVHLFVCPAIIGGGTRALPDRVRLDLELVDERRFSSGVVYMRHRVARRA